MNLRYLRLRQNLANQPFCKLLGSSGICSPFVRSCFQFAKRGFPLVGSCAEALFSHPHTPVSPSKLDSLLVDCHAVIGKDESIFLRRVWGTFSGRKKVRNPRVLHLAYLASLVENVAVLFVVTAFTFPFLFAVLFVVTAFIFPYLVAVLFAVTATTFPYLVAVLFEITATTFPFLFAVLFEITACIFPHALLAVRSSSACPSLVPVETVQRLHHSTLRARLRHSCSSPRGTAHGRNPATAYPTPLPHASTP